MQPARQTPARAVKTAAGELDFDERGLPWIDRPDADIEGYLKSLKSLPDSYDLGEKLAHWRELGYVVFENAADAALIDTYLQNLDEVLANHQKYNVIANHEKRGRVPICQLDKNEVSHPHMRLVNLHNLSPAGKKLALNPVVVSFLSHVLRDQVVAMQTLTFIHGSEQRPHQDFAFVVSGIPSHLAASWIALEDIQADAGPLGYFPGSHRIRKFDFGNGPFMTPKSTRGTDEFASHILSECSRLGLTMHTFLPKKGDVFIWHAALAHSGTPAISRGRSRLSFVTHYSTATAYPFDRRDPKIVPRRQYFNGGFLYEDPSHPEDEDLFDA